MMCDRCKHAGSVGGYPDGQDMFVCESDDPRVPFNMDEDTVCPAFELDERYKIDECGDSFCPHCGECLSIDEFVYQDVGQDGYSTFEDILLCENCGRRYHREYSQHIVIDDCEIEEIEEE